jgi:hypothetical protein
VRRVEQLPGSCCAGAQAPPPGAHHAAAVPAAPLDGPPQPVQLPARERHHAVARLQAPQARQRLALHHQRGQAPVSPDLQQRSRLRWEGWGLEGAAVSLAAGAAQAAGSGSGR